MLQLFSQPSTMENTKPATQEASKKGKCDCDYLMSLISLLGSEKDAFIVLDFV